MGEPRSTTVDNLNRADIGEVIRFTLADAAIEAVLLDLRSWRTGYEFRLRFYSGPPFLLGRLESDWIGPVNSWQPVDVLSKQAGIHVGPQAASDLADRLDPVQADLLRQLRQRGESEN